MSMNAQRCINSNLKHAYVFSIQENSFEDLRSNVIKKLGLNAEASLGFSQSRDGKSIDLEDGAYMHVRSS